jgi:hypothetical protein
VSIYTDAADLLESEGWVQGAYHVTPDLIGPHYDHVGYCMIGALLEVDGVDLSRSSSAADRAAGRYAKDLGFSVNLVSGRRVDVDAASWQVMSRWNDAAGRTAAQVIAVLRGEVAPDDV